MTALITRGLAISCGGCHHGSESSADATSFGSDTIPPGSRIFHLRRDTARIGLIITPGTLTVTDMEVQNWVHRSALALEHYFGRFPVRQVRIKILAAEVGEIGDGLTTDDGIRVTVGPDATKADLDDDWIMVHEMFHLAFPDMDDRYIWLREGLASYLEPLARARVGTIAVQKVWLDLYEGLPRGEPKMNDQGLDNTHTQGRTYWGGSLFCLLADLQIREQTNNRRSLDDAMRAILDQGGDRYVHWSMDHVIEVCNQSTGTTVMRDLYGKMCTTPVSVDLHTLWKRVGVKKERGGVVFDDAAPLAKIRQSMTTG